MQNAIRRLMRPDDMLETFSELAVREPDSMRLVLQASVAAMVNVQSVEAEHKLIRVVGYVKGCLSMSEFESSLRFIPRTCIYVDVAL